MTNNELIDFTCERFKAADCETALQTCAVALQQDIADGQPYTLVLDALDRIRAAYSLRLAELREVR